LGRSQRASADFERRHTVMDDIDRKILKLLQDTCRKQKMTVLVITHNSAIAPMADRVIRIKNGKAASVRTNPSPMSVEDIEW